MGDLGRPATERRGLSLGARLARLWRYHPLAVVAAALLAFGSGAAIVGTTFASFLSITANTTASFEGGWVGTATNLSVTPSGYDGVLNWTGAHGATGRQIQSVDNGSSSTCPGSGYSTIATLGAVTTYTDSHATNTLNGHYVCYRVMGTNGNWTGTPTSFPATQLGLVATAVTINNAGQGTLANGDTVVVTYNQQPTLTALTASVCVAWPGGTAPVAASIYLDYSGSCATTVTGYQLSLTGLTKGTSGTVTAGTATATLSAPTVSGSAPWTVTYTLSANLTANPGLNSGTATALPDGTGNVKSAAVTDQANACTNATYNCQPTTSTSL